MPDDFLFNSRMKPHGIKGTKGAQVIKELQPQHSDIIVPKPRFSGFFKTNLEGMLRELGVDTLVVCGVATEICVISTAYDAVCSDFKVIIIDDCCASRSKVVHDQLLEILRRSPLHPLLRVMSLNDFLRTV
jgi:nicotinamidase/pyrazinamidase